MPADVAVVPEPVVTPELAASATPEPVISGAPPTPSPTPQFTYKEKRDDWVPPDKFKAAEAATIKAAREIERYKAELVQERQRIAALAGVTPRSPEADEQAKIAEAFYALPQFAHLRGLTPDTMQRLMALAERGEDYEAATKHQWDGLARRTLRTVVDKVQDVLGLDTVDADLAEEIEDSFKRTARRDPEAFRTRYEAEDPTLVDEFVKRYTEKFIDPIRRSATASLTRPAQARVPRGGPSQPVTVQKPKRDYSKLSHADAAQAAEDDAVAYLKEHGMLQDADRRW